MSESELDMTYCCDVARERHRKHVATFAKPGSVNTYTTDDWRWSWSDTVVVIFMAQVLALVSMVGMSMKHPDAVGCASPMRRFEVAVPLFRAGCVVVNGVGPAIDWLGEPIGSE